jgi:hypothetical protein
VFISNGVSAAGRRAGAHVNGSGRFEITDGALAEGAKAGGWIVDRNRHFQMDCGTQRVTAKVHLINSDYLLNGLVLADDELAQTPFD